MAAAGPAKRYQSTFKAPQHRSEFSSAAALTYDSHSFIRTFCTVNLQGGITLVKKSEPETILVAKGWQKFARAKDAPSAPTEGYLSRGFSKYAFRVSHPILPPYSLADIIISSTGHSWACAPCNISNKVSRVLWINRS